MPSYPADKETFPAWVDRDLSIAELGTRILKSNMDPVRDCVERIQDALGYTVSANTLREDAFLWSLMGRIR